MSDDVINQGDPDGDGTDSRDCVDLFVDGPGDTTVRPMPPHLVRQLREKEERRARLMELWKQQQEQEKAKESLETDKGTEP
jgi:hypothetical protein